jgi:Ice-binding-like
MFVIHDDQSIDRYAETPQRLLRGPGARLRGMAQLIFGLLALALASSAQAQTVSLGTTGSFAVLGGSTVTNTGPSVINGDLGVSPGTAVTGFPPGIVNGTIHAADAVALQAQSDLTTAYNDAAGRACNTVLTGQDLGGLTLTPGVYCFATSAQLTGTLILNAQGNADAVFIFQIGSTLTTASNSTVSLINGAQSCNIFWQVGSSATLGTTTMFRGNILALTSNTAATGATVDGRLLARNGAVTLDNNVVTRAQCATSPGGTPPGGTPPGGTPPGETPPGETPPGETPPGETDETRPVVLVHGAPGDGIPGNPVAVGGIPRCLATDFRLRIRASDSSGIRRVEVFLDGRLIKRTAQGRFYVWIRAQRLHAARHTIRVVAHDNAGNRTVQTRSFRRCARSVLPALTG